MKYAPVLGRWLLAHIFLISGVGKIGGFAGTQAYIASKGFPVPGFLTLAAIVVELAGAASLILGYRVLWGALALIVFTLMGAFFFHDFWSYEEGMQRTFQRINFMKNLSIVGGLLYVAACGPGPFSLDRRAARSV